MMEVRTSEAYVPQENSSTPGQMRIRMYANLGVRFMRIVWYRC